MAFIWRTNKAKSFSPTDLEKQLFWFDSVVYIGALHSPCSNKMSVDDRGNWCGCFPWADLWLYKPT